MKNVRFEPKKLYQLTTIFLITASMYGGRASADSCPTPDWEKIFTELSASTRFSESINIRRSYLDKMCSLEDFDKLTDLEVNSPYGDFYKPYMSAVADFIIDEIDSFLAVNRLSKDLDVLTQHLLPKMVTIDQNLQLREKFLKEVKTCRDFQALTYPWTSVKDSSLSEALEDFQNRNEKTYCDKTK